MHCFAQVPGSHYYFADLRWPKPLAAKITVLDLGAGAAVHVRASRADWLFDCGSARDYEQVLRPYLHFAGVNRIDGLLLTHGDSLHIGGAEPLLQDFSPAVLIDNPSADRSTIHRRLRYIFAFRRLNATTHEKFPISSDVAAQILFPPLEFTANTADDQAFLVQLSMKTAKLFRQDESGAVELEFGADHWEARSYLTGEVFRSDNR